MLKKVNIFLESDLSVATEIEIDRSISDLDELKQLFKNSCEKYDIDLTDCYFKNPTSGYYVFRLADLENDDVKSLHLVDIEKDVKEQITMMNELFDLVSCPE